MKRLIILLVSLCCVTHGAVVINVEEVGQDIVVSGSGSFNLTGLTQIGGQALFGAVGSANGIMRLGGPNSDHYYNMYQTVSGPLFTMDYATASSFTGDRFGLMASVGFIYTPQLYVSGTQLSGTMTLLNRSFESLNATQGTYVYTWGEGENADSLTLNIGEAEVAVPEPASAVTMLLGIGLLFLLRHKRLPAR